MAFRQSVGLILWLGNEALVAIRFRGKLEVKSPCIEPDFKVPQAIWFASSKTFGSASTESKTQWFVSKKAIGGTLYADPSDSEIREVTYRIRQYGFAENLHLMRSRFMRK
ncbi:hypothetical protein F5146DRAFT_1002027 [Armillaria mellea]|nr:hypothetical protein F5146DRAFT_1002027 [Armillaria mellea]